MREAQQRGRSLWELEAFYSRETHRAEGAYDRLNVLDASTLGLSTATVVLLRGGSTHNQRLEISGVLLLVAAVIVGAYYG